MKPYKGWEEDKKRRQKETKSCHYLKNVNKISASSLKLDVSISLQTSPGKLSVMKWKRFTRKSKRMQKKRKETKQKRNKNETKQKNCKRKYKIKALGLYSLISEAVLHLKAYLPLWRDLPQVCSTGTCSLWSVEETSASWEIRQRVS